MNKIIISEDELKQKLVWSETKGSRTEIFLNKGVCENWTEESNVIINQQKYRIEASCWVDYYAYRGEASLGEIDIFNDAGESVVNKITTNEQDKLIEDFFGGYDQSIEGKDYAEDLFFLFQGERKKEIERREREKEAERARQIKRNEERDKEVEEERKIKNKELLSFLESSKLSSIKLIDDTSYYNDGPFWLIPRDINQAILEGSDSIRYLYEAKGTTVSNSGKTLFNVFQINKGGVDRRCESTNRSSPDLLDQVKIFLHEIKYLPEVKIWPPHIIV